MRHILSFIGLLLLGLSLTANAQDPVPVQVLPAGVVANVTGNRLSVKEKNMVVAGNSTKGYEAFFAATDASGEQLWKTNGTALASKVSSFASGANIRWMARFNDQVVLQALGKLYISDGTTVNEITMNGASFVDPQAFTQINEKHFVFTARVGSYYQLFRSNGERAELVYADDAAGFTCYYPGEFHADDLNAPWCRVGRKVYFKAITAAAGEELWITDGTAAGTYMVKDINEGVDGSAVTKMVNVNNTYLVFKAWNTIHGNYLWYSDGTEEGTANFENANLSQYDNVPRNVAVLNGKVYTGIVDQTYGSELYAFDPATGNSELVKDFNTGSGDSWPDVLGEYQGQLMTIANAGACDLYAVKENGEAQKAGWTLAFPDNGYAKVNGSFYTYGLNAGWGLYRVNSISEMSSPAFIYDGVASGNGSDGVPCGYTLRAAGDKLFFAVTSGDWAHASDNRGIFCYSYCKAGGVAENMEIDFGSQGPHGTDADPMQVLPAGVVANITGNIYSVKEKNMVVAGSPSKGYEAFFAATDASGEQLWMTNGNLLAKKVSAFAADANIRWLARFNDKVVFQALGKLYISDGTSVNEIKVGANSLVDPLGFTQIDENQFIFTAKVGDYYQLFRSNGISAELVYADDAAGFCCIFPGEMHINDLNAPWCRVGRKVYFKAVTAAAGLELWITDGTTAGTYMVKDIAEGTAGSAITKMINVNNRHLVFKAWSAEKGNFIWYTDGTEEGTKPFEAAGLSTYENVPRNMAVMNGKVYTGIGNQSLGVELYAFNPATGLGEFVKDFNTGSGNSYPDVLNVYEGQLMTIAQVGVCDIYAVANNGEVQKGGWDVAFPDNGYAIVNGTFYTYGLYPARGGDWGLYSIDSLADMPTATSIYNGLALKTGLDGVPCGYTLRAAGNKLFFAVTAGDPDHDSENRGVFCYEYCKKGGAAENLEEDYDVVTITLSEEIDNMAYINDNNLDGQQVDVQLTRTFIADGYNYTLCLPFAMSSEQISDAFGACTLYRLADSYMKGEVLYLEFGKETQTEAGVAYLFCPESTVANTSIVGVTIDASAPVDARVGTGKAKFVGVYAPKSDLDGLYILTDENWLRLAGEGEMLALRGYFDLSGAPAHVAARATFRQEPTELPSVDATTPSQKIVDNGIIYILRNGNKYSILGQQCK